ncbi:hypothetical protein SLS58_006428 [Diplodia intermedia]|uniref:Uncharacterized protein n=1 Tax=Diplodia intermedia TaxID=856260 RepID=A0ABR3TN61_9PEZI
MPGGQGSSSSAPGGFFAPVPGDQYRLRLVRPGMPTNDMPPDPERYFRLARRGSNRDPGREWSPPNAEHEYISEENVARLRAFQDMTPDQQRRVIHLHLQRQHTPAEAIDAVLTEIRLDLLSLPVPMREQHTANVRLELAQTNDTMYRQWHVLECVLNNLPAQYHEARRRVGLVFVADPLNPKDVMDARRLAGDTIGLGVVNRLLDEMVRNAFIHRRQEDELRSLRLYDRYQGPRDPPALDADDNVLTALQKVMSKETLSDELTDRIDFNLNDLKSAIQTFVMLVFVENSDNAAVQAVYNERQLGQTRDWDLPAIVSELMELVGGAKELEAVDVSNPLQIMCMALYGTCLGIEERIGFPQLEIALHIHEISSELIEEALDTMFDAVNAVYMTNQTYSGKIYWAFREDLQSLRPSHPQVGELIAALSGSTDAFRRIFTTNNWSLLPQVTRAMALSYLLTCEASDPLRSLQGDLTALRVCLGHQHRQFISLDALPNAPRPTDCPVANLGAHRAALIAARATALDALQHLLRRFEDLTDLCPHPRARADILAIFAASPASPDLARIRNLAAVANARTLAASADVALKNTALLAASAARLTHLEARDHVHRISRYPPRAVADALADRRDDVAGIWDALAPLGLPQTAPVDAVLGSWRFGDALRAVAGDGELLGDAAYALCMAALRGPTEDACAVLVGEGEGEEGAGRWAAGDAVLVARVLLRAWYLAEEMAPRAAGDRGRLLARHCWQVGLYNAWVAWYEGMGGLLGSAMPWFRAGGGRALVALPLDGDEDGDEEGDVVNVMDALGDPGRRWKVITAMVEAGLTDVFGDPEGAVRRMEEVVAMLNRLDRLRKATEKFLLCPDWLDPNVLPEDLCAVGDGAPDETVEAYGELHDLVEFRGCVLDGGVLVVRDDGAIYDDGSSDTDMMDAEEEFDFP